MNILQYSSDKDTLINELELLLSGKTMKKLSGIPKKCYKYSLTSIYINMCSGRQLTKGQEENFTWAYSIKNNPNEFNNEGILQHLKSTVENSLKQSNFYNFDAYSTVDEIINLFRSIVEGIKKHETYFINISELSELIDVKKFFSNSHPYVQPHHWVNVDLYTGMVLTVPEFFTYADIINSWNMLLDKIEIYDSYINEMDDTPLIERRNDVQSRRIKYEIDTLMRLIWISSVTFVESYLYYLFYNIKHSDFELKESSKKFLENQKVEDEEILKRLIIPEFIGRETKEIKDLIKNYRKINSMRNRLIHPSAFPGNEVSELSALLTVDSEKLVDVLESCTKIVKYVDENLPEHLKILHWWDRITHPDFKNYEKGDITNPNSLMSSIKYE